MARPPRLLIAGGYGTFGRLLARELLITTDSRLVIAGRDARRAAAMCRALDGGARTEPLALDLSRPAQLARAATGCFAVLCAAGPFQDLDPALVRVSIQAGAHWLDISDDPAWIHALLDDTQLDATARAANLVVLPGQSSVPALSGALTRWCLDRTPDAHAAQVTLFIGNRNPKTSGAVASVLRSGLSHPAVVDLPTGRHTTYRVGPPDALSLDGLNLPVEFRVAFESRLAGRTLSLTSQLTKKLGPSAHRRLAATLVTLAAPFQHFGSRTGCVQAAVRDQHGHETSAALLSDGQRLAILPCALAIETLLSGQLQERGVLHPSAWLPPDEWITQLRARGIRFASG